MRRSRRRKSSGGVEGDQGDNTGVVKGEKEEVKEDAMEEEEAVGGAGRAVQPELHLRRMTSWKMFMWQSDSLAKMESIIDKSGK